MLPEFRMKVREALTLHGLVLATDAIEQLPMEGAIGEQLYNLGVRYVVLCTQIAYRAHRMQELAFRVETLAGLGRLTGEDNLAPVAVELEEKRRELASVSQTLKGLVDLWSAHLMMVELEAGSGA